jgi:hypothetical protein
MCALLLCFYGVSKLTGHQLVAPGGIAQEPIGLLSGYNLTWYYFGYSHPYKYILGVVQLSCALLLLFRKSALIAALMTVPMMFNILLINIFYSISRGAELNAVFILVSMLLLLWHQREALYETLWGSQPQEPRSSEKWHWIMRGIILFLIVGQILFGMVHPK